MKAEAALRCPRCQGPVMDISSAASSIEQFECVAGAAGCGWRGLTPEKGEPKIKEATMAKDSTKCPVKYCRSLLPCAQHPAGATPKVRQSRRGGGRSTRRSPVGTAAIHTTANANGLDWAEWKASLESELDDAEGKLMAQIEKVKRAREAIAAL